MLLYESREFSEKHASDNTSLGGTQENYSKPNEDFLEGHWVTFAAKHYKPKIEIFSGKVFIGTYMMCM